MSEKKPNLYQKICKIMGEVPSVVKGATVQAGRNSTYRAVQHDDVARALQPRFSKYGIVCVVDVVNCKTERYTVSTQYGEKLCYDTQITCCISLINADNPDERISAHGFGHAIDTQDKGPGKAESYAVKYALLKLFQIPSMDEEEQRIFQGEKMAPATKPSASQKEKAVEIYEKVGGGRLQEFVKQINQMSSAQLDETIIKLQKRAKQ